MSRSRKGENGKKQQMSTTLNFEITFEGFVDEFDDRAHRLGILFRIGLDEIISLDTPFADRGPRLCFVCKLGFAGKSAVGFVGDGHVVPVVAPDPFSHQIVCT